MLSKDTKVNISLLAHSINLFKINFIIPRLFTDTMLKYKTVYTFKLVVWNISAELRVSQRPRFWKKKTSFS